MKKSYTKIVSVSVCLILAISACKKDSSENNNAGIVGNWTLSQIGTDANSNNVVDVSEIAGVAVFGVSGTYSFNSNKTYTGAITESGSTITESGTYTYSNKILTTISSGSTTVLTVNSVTSNKLVLKDESSAPDPGTWIIYTK